MQNEERTHIETWIAAAELRYTADLRMPEIARALRALSSAYVERRRRGSGQHVHAALDSAGKRAAFALYYAPLHFIAVGAAVRELGADVPAPAAIVDYGCGTGAAGAAWALAAGGTSAVLGLDRHPWAVAEARWTFAQLAVNGRVARCDVDRARAPRPGEGALAAYTLNELPDAARDRVERRLLDAAQRGSRVLVIEPLARGVVPWWPAAARRWSSRRGRADEWKLAVDPPRIVQQLGDAAGLNCRELGFRTLFL